MRKGYRKYAVIFLLLGLMLAWTPVYGEEWYVYSGAVAGGNGKSWSQAFQTIQQAVNAAESIWMICMAPPDRIHVRDGTYRLTTPINIGKYVTILGGYNYKGVRNWQNFLTIIDGQDVTRCLNVTGPCIIDGFRIRNGTTAGNGGGLSIDSTPTYCSTLDFYHVPKIRNCMIDDNTGGSDGYGIGGGNL
jgi:hypothetical protein